jgi:phage/plasmid-like protein (TIGR03299 family)
MTVTTDVNAAFAAERAAQQAQVAAFNAEAEAYNAIPLAERQSAADAAQLARFEDRVAKGELVKIGDNRYQATTGWDRGETFTLRQSATGDRQLLVMPEHGLDLMEGGKAKLYSAVPAWHGLGQVIPGGITDVDDVIKLGGLDVKVFSIPAPGFTLPGHGDKVFSAPGQFYVGNEDTGEFWGTVGKVHKNIDVRTSFAFMQNVIGQQGITWESAGLMGGGRKVFISCKVPAGIMIDEGGLNERSEMFLVVQDTRDGSSSYKAMITPWRPLCANTNRFALRDAQSVIALRHTSGLPSQLEKARKVLGLTVEYAGAFAAEETALARTETTLREFRELMGELFADGKKDTDASGRVYGGRLRDSESVRTSNANDRREADLEYRFETERERVGTTLYAAEQAYTGHLDWGKVRKGDSKVAAWQNRIEASLAGTDDADKSKGHQRLMQLVGGGTERR